MTDMMIDSPEERLRQRFVPLAPTQIPAASKVLGDSFQEELHQVNVPQPHWYLLMLGVDPAYQNQGVGSSLMQRILERADRENLPCYLETSTQKGVRFYQRHNFEIVEAIDFPQSGFQVWTMIREPQPTTIDNASQ